LKSEEVFYERNGDNTSELVNKKVNLQRIDFERLDREASDLGLKRASYLRSILQFYWENPDLYILVKTVEDLEEKFDSLEEYVRPNKDECKEAARLLRGIRNDSKVIREELIEK
jgi:hypothetical protein